MYFEKPGKANTAETLRIAVREAKARDLAAVIVASNTGATAQALLAEAQSQGYGGKLVCVSHVNGFMEPGVSEMPEAVRAALEEGGMRVYTAGHVLSGAERAISRQFQGAYPVEIIAHSLRMLGQGLKVCVETAVMALDGGMIPYGNPVAAIGGTGSGADTAALLTPAHGSAIFGTRIHEIFCKPVLA